MQKLSLPSVTLVTVDTICHELTRRALQRCLDVADFGDVLVLSDKPILPNHWVKCKASSTKDISDIYYKVLPKLIKTDFMCIIHWDSWIVHPDVWLPEFLSHSYIGAPWWYPANNVGNSGFSIRSTAMARYIADSDLEHAFPDDAVICRSHRPKLELVGFTFASTALAGHFAFERNILYPLDEIFGFHGIFNWPLVLPYEELEEIAQLAYENKYVRSRPEYCEFEMKLTQLRYDRITGVVNG